MRGDKILTSKASKTQGWGTSGCSPTPSSPKRLWAPAPCQALGQSLTVGCR